MRLVLQTAITETKSGHFEEDIIIQTGSKKDGI